MTTTQPPHALPGSEAPQEDAYAVDVSGMFSGQVFTGTLSRVINMQPSALFRRLQKTDGTIVLQQLWHDPNGRERQWREPELVQEDNLPDNHHRDFFPTSK